MGVVAPGPPQCAHLFSLPSAPEQERKWPWAPLHFEVPDPS